MSLWGFDQSAHPSPSCLLGTVSRFGEKGLLGGVPLVLSLREHMLGLNLFGPCHFKFGTEAGVYSAAEESLRDLAMRDPGRKVRMCVLKGSPRGRPSSCIIVS